MMDHGKGTDDKIQVPRTKFQETRNKNQVPRDNIQVPRTKRMKDMNCKQEKVYEITEKTPLKFEVKEPGVGYAIDLKERTFEFAIAIIELLKTVPYNKENDVIRYQLAKSGSSIGANYEEAQATSSKADFRHKINIVLKETRESNYWLRIMQRAKIGDQKAITILIQESFELRNIFGSIYNKVRT